jgi:actin-related protein 3
MEKPAVVIDNGTGYTKMGYAGNTEPSFIIPSVIATKDPKMVRSASACCHGLLAAATACSLPHRASRPYVFTAASQARKDWKGVEDLDFWIGDEAMARANEYTINYPIRHGIVENWDSMERYWQRCMFKYLRCDPEVRACRIARWLVWLGRVRAPAQCVPKAGRLQI